jgi:Xaa-Pro dipeptidase
MDRRQEVQAKHEGVRAFMDRAGLGAVVLTQRWNFAWYTAGGQNYVNHASDTGVASLVISKDRAVCVTSNIEAERIAREEVAGLGIEVIGCDWWDGGVTARVLADLLGQKKAAADVRVAGLGSGVGALPSEFDQLRMQLLPAEMERFREVGRLTGEALEWACRNFRQGGTEYDLAGLVSQAAWQRQLKPHVVLVAGDERLDLWRHPVATGQQIRRRAMAVVCAERGGLIASATRIFSFGEPEPAWHDRQRAICRVDAEMMDATRVGRTLGDVFAAAEQAYERAGYGDGWKHHHQGGPTGYRTRDGRATPGNPAVIQANQAFAWNPSLVAAKSEDTILLTTVGFEVITASGQWPGVGVEVGGKRLDRPDILVR